MIRYFLILFLFILTMNLNSQIIYDSNKVIISLDLWNKIKKKTITYYYQNIYKDTIIENQKQIIERQDTLINTKDEIINNYEKLINNINKSNNETITWNGIDIGIKPYYIIKSETLKFIDNLYLSIYIRTGLTLVNSYNLEIQYIIPFQAKDKGTIIELIIGKTIIK